MQAISKVEVSCIPKNTEKYISLSLGQQRFIDSAQFLLASLDKLVAVNQPEAFQITAQHESNETRRKLIMCKGVYPYQYMDSWGCFEETQLLPKEAFYGKLSDENITRRTMPMRGRSGRPFGARPWGNYSSLYCRIDVLLLADVFEIFLKTCLCQYGLDPAPYYTSQASARTPCSRRQALS